jgi:hypothetical protein
METDGVRAIGRATQGVRLINIDDEDRVVGMAKLDVDESARNDDSPAGTLAEPAGGEPGDGENGPPDAA